MRFDDTNPAKEKVDFEKVKKLFKKKLLIKMISGYTRGLENA